MLSVRGLSAEALGPVDFDLSAGECLGIRGASGSGKSRLMRLLADLDAHTGQVSLGGLDRSRIEPVEWRRRVAYLPSDSAWWGFRVADSLLDPAALNPAALGLPDTILDQEIALLSSGERQRLALLRQLQLEPCVLMLDEPTANLDTESTHQFEVLSKAWLDGGERALLWISHDDRQLGRVADRQMRMDRGRLEVFG